jgi:hypothetical protein
MTFPELLQWQWSDYSEKHRNRVNLLIHIVAVPFFLVGAVNFAYSVLGLLLFKFEVARAFFAVVLMGVSLFAQSRGHALETRPPERFTSGKDAVRRLLAEQFVTFPRFVLSGGWSDNLQRTET